MSPELDELVELVADCMEKHKLLGEGYCSACDQLIWLLVVLKDIEEQPT